MNSPDFVTVGLQHLSSNDLLFLFEHFPVAGVDPVEAVQRVHAQPQMLESMLEAAYVREAMMANETFCLNISPQLFFDVMLRHALPGPRSMLDRQSIHYLANLLGRFVSSERVYRVQPGERERFEYIADLVQEGMSSGPERQFLIDAHIGNYTLYLSGLCARWVEHRRVYKRRPVSLDYYKRMGQSHFEHAADSREAEKFGLRDVFRHLSGHFEYFREGLEKLAATVMPRKDAVHQF